MNKSISLLLIIFASIFSAEAMYDPTQGRFFNRDPIEEGSELNIYSFVGNDSIGRYDFLGLLTVYIWKSRDKEKNPAKILPAVLNSPESNVGHVAIKLEDGTYLSFWPDKKGNHQNYFRDEIYKGYLAETSIDWYTVGLPGSRGSTFGEQLEEKYQEFLKKPADERMKLLSEARLKWEEKVEGNPADYSWEMKSPCIDEAAIKKWFFEKHCSTRWTLGGMNCSSGSLGALKAGSTPGTDNIGRFIPWPNALIETMDKIKKAVDSGKCCKKFSMLPDRCCKPFSMSP